MSRLVPLDSPLELDDMARLCFERVAADELARIDAKLSREKRQTEAEMHSTDSPAGCGWMLMVASVFAGSCVATAAATDVLGGGAALLLFGGWGGGFYLLAKGPGGVTRAIERKRRKDEIDRATANSIAAYAAREPWAVQRVHEFAVREFRRRIARHRDRTLGSDSEWGKVRSSLAEAADGAQRSTAYWRERLRTDPDSELAAIQSRVARRLEAKLASALEKADDRAAALRRFYNDCEAKLAVMDRSNQDMAESRRLAELSDSADMVIASAEETIQLLAQRFVAEAQAIAASLSGAAEVGIKSLAGEAPLENIEHLADAVIESSERERSAIEELERRLNES